MNTKISFYSILYTVQTGLYVYSKYWYIYISYSYQLISLSLSIYIYTCIYVYLQIHRYIVADEYLEPGFEKICWTELTVHRHRYRAYSVQLLLNSPTSLTLTGIRLPNNVLVILGVPKTWRCIGWWYLLRGGSQVQLWKKVFQHTVLLVVFWSTMWFQDLFVVSKL